MKINYRFEDDLSKKEKWSIFNEMQGVLLSRRIFKKNENAKLKTLFGHNINRLGFYLFVILSNIIFFVLLKNAVFLVFSILMGIVSIYYILYYFIYFRRFANAVSVGDSILEFNENGFEDSNKENKLFYSWNKIDYVVIGYYSIIFILKDELLFFHYPVELESKIMKAIQKYQPKLKVLDKRR